MRQADVIVQVAVENPEPLIDLRRDGDEQQLGVQFGEREGSGQGPQPHSGPGRLSRQRDGIGGGQPRPDRDRVLVGTCVARPAGYGQAAW